MAWRHAQRLVVNANNAHSVPSEEVDSALHSGDFMVDASDAHGFTALHWASMAGRTDLVGVLLQNGADALAVAADRTTPAELALRFGHGDVYSLYECMTQHSSSVAGCGTLGVSARGLMPAPDPNGRVRRPRVRQNTSDAGGDMVALARALTPGTRDPRLLRARGARRRLLLTKATMLRRAGRAACHGVTDGATTVRAIASDWARRDALLLEPPLRRTMWRLWRAIDAALGTPLSKQGFCAVSLELWKQLEQLCHAEHGSTPSARSSPDPGGSPGSSRSPTPGPGPGRVSPHAHFQLKGAARVHEALEHDEALVEATVTDIEADWEEDIRNQERRIALALSAGSGSGSGPRGEGLDALRGAAPRMCFSTFALSVFESLDRRCAGVDRLGDFVELLEDLTASITYIELPPPQQQPHDRGRDRVSSAKATADADADPDAGLRLRQTPPYWHELSRRARLQS